MSNRVAPSCTVASPDGFANATASCPLGLEWVEKKKGYKNEFVRFALFGAETEAIMHHVDAEKQKDYYFHVEASAIRRAGERGFGKLCGARKDKQEVRNSTQFHPIPPNSTRIHPIPPNSTRIHPIPPKSTRIHPVARRSKP
jgi:hypothetical protein